MVKFGFVENGWLWLSLLELEDGSSNDHKSMLVSQVIFEEIADSYLVSGDLVCSYSLTPGLEPGHGDRVGLYRLPFLQVAFFCKI